MAVPRKKHSVTQRKMRHTHRQTVNLQRMEKLVSLGKCSNCGAVIQSYTVCKVCGYYNGKQVMTIKTKSKEKIVEA